MAYFSTCNVQDCVVREPKIFAMWPLTKKSAKPWPILYIFNNYNLHLSINKPFYLQQNTSISTIYGLILSYILFLYVMKAPNA